MVFAVGGPLQQRVEGYDCEIHAIYVLAKHQRRGVGRKLVEAVVARLLHQDHRSLLVWVVTENPYRAFNEQLGGPRRDLAPFPAGGTKPP